MPVQSPNKTQNPDLRILYLEDNPMDAELVRVILGSAGINCTIKRIETREDFEASIEQEVWDLIISDFTLPEFDGVSALGLVRKKDPEVPFIFVSGTLGEDSAVESLRQGATDYILKDRMSRLAASVCRALHEAQVRTERRRDEQKIREQGVLLDRAHDAICLTDMEQRVLYWNKGAEHIFGWSAQEILHQNLNALLFRPDDQRPLEALRHLIRSDRKSTRL